MSNNVIQPNFNTGEWSPSLYAQVNLKQYHSGAALLRNFFVDYRGGATTCPGTRYVLQAYNSGFPVRLIPFQASLTVSYMLEFGSTGLSGQGYIRFISNGAYVVEGALAITGASQANPCVLQVVNGYAAGDWIYISGVNGMTQLNGNYYNITSRTAGTITLSDLNGVAVNSTTFGAWTSGGTVQRVYKIASPFFANELAQIKFVQNVNVMIMTHPNHPPQQLTLISALNWTIAAIGFGANIAAPAGLAGGSTLAAGVVNYSYLVTAEDSNNQESGPSAPFALANLLDIRANPGTNTITWGAVTGATSYNVYRAELRYGAAVPAGAQYGFIGNCTGNVFIDSNIIPDFSQGPPVPQNPFNGAGVASVALTAQGSFTPSTSSVAVPLVTFTGGGGTGAAAYVTMGVIGVAIANGGTGYNIGDIIIVYGAGGLAVQVTGVTGFTNAISSVAIVNAGTTNTTMVGNPTPQSSTNGIGSGAFFTLTWGVITISLTSAGVNYGAAPAVNFSYSGATAVASLGATSFGNPTVPAIQNQRLALMGPPGSPQQMNFSQPGLLYDFDITNPIQPDNAITATLFAGQINIIQSAISMPQGLIVLTDKQAWLVNGGSPSSAISATSIVANSQVYSGASFVPPIVAGDNILYVQAKGSIVRNLIFNYYTQVYTGTDISVLSNHLFKDYQILEWCWAEEPFKLAWAVRSDGVLLPLTFLKDLEIVGWAHRDTQGLFKSIASVTETTASGTIVDAVYTVAQRTVNGNLVQYIERMVDLSYPHGTTDAWQVDSGIQYNGLPVLTFQGAQHLAGLSVTGLATDNLGNVTVINSFVMPASGIFTLTAPTPVGATGYTRVTIGLSFLPQLTTLPLDLGEPTVQGKRKNVHAVTVRVRDTLGLTAGKVPSTGPGTSTQTPMKDLVLGNVGSMSNKLVTGLVTSDARTTIDPQWDVFGQYTIEQPNPYPASILGVIPEIAIGDAPK